MPDPKGAAAADTEGTPFQRHLSQARQWPVASADHAPTETTTFGRQTESDDDGRYFTGDDHHVVYSAAVGELLRHGRSDPRKLPFKEPLNFLPFLLSLHY